MYLSSNDLHEYFKNEIEYLYELDSDIKNAIFDNDIIPPESRMFNNDAEEVESLIWNVLIRGIGHTASTLNYKHIKFNVSNKTYKRFKNNIDINKVSDLLKELKVQELYQQSKKYASEYASDKNSICSPLEEFFLKCSKINRRTSYTC